MLKVPVLGPSGLVQVCNWEYSPSFTLVECCHMMPLCPNFKASNRTLAFSLEILIHKKKIFQPGTSVGQGTICNLELLSRDKEVQTDPSRISMWQVILEGAVCWVACVG